MVIDKNLSTWTKLGAAIIVALHHYSQYVCGNGLSSNILYQILSLQGGYLAVAVFFFLSGYGLNESEKKKHLSFSVFLKKRWLKIYIPTLLVTAIWIPIEILFKGPHTVEGGILSLIYRLFVGFDDGVLWFLKVLFILYFTFAVYAYVKKKFNQLYANASINLMTIAVIVIVWYVFPIYCTVSVPMFLLGIMTSNCIDKESSLLKLMLCIFIWGMIVCSYLFLFVTKAMCMHAAINYILLIIAILIIYKYPISITTTSKLSLGSISFSIYLVHGKVLNILKDTMDTITLLDFLVYTIVFVSTFYVLKEKMKI